MNKMGIVFRFEFIQQMKKRSVRIFMVVLALLFFAAGALPAVLHQFRIGESEDTATGSVYDLAEGGYYIEDPDLQKLMGIPDEHSYASEHDLKAAIRDKEEEIGYVVYDAAHFKTVYGDKTLLSQSSSSVLHDFLHNYLVEKTLEKENVPAETFRAIQNIPIRADEEVVGRDTGSQYFIGFVFVILLYFAILLYGQSVSMAVAREKDSRTMELLITATDPRDLIMGKVLAVIAASMVQFGFMLASGILSLICFRGLYAEGLQTFLAEAFDFSMAGIYVLYFVLGVMLYMFIYAALGSVVSKIEDLGTAVSPIIFLFVIGYLIATMALNGMDSLLVRIGSWIPFFSVLVMPIRYAFFSTSVWEILGSTVLTILTIILFARISVRIYRWGSLNYGNKNNIFRVLREVFKKN